MYTYYLIALQLCVNIYGLIPVFYAWLLPFFFFSEKQMQLKNIKSCRLQKLHILDDRNSYNFTPSFNLKRPSCTPSCVNKFIPTCPRIGYKVYTQNIFITNKNKQCQRKKKLYIYTIHFNVVTADWLRYKFSCLSTSYNKGNKWFRNCYRVNVGV